ncbi:M20/M25/M40 family metallo-hydrolase [Candidatus Uhrbacteria bacterium]|nr:M20/M25/M40 family metallo-hydrolase [Candidatus Uhrbacteria bacterium]
MTASIIQITQDLVRMRTTTDRLDELKRAVDYIGAYFADVPSLIVKRFEQNGKPSIVVSTQDTLTPDILLLGHLDVVPAPDDFFEPRMEGTKMMGRGVCDMKSECAVMMQMMRECSAVDARPNIALMLTTDEEIGGEDGAGYLVNTIGYRAKVAIVPDGARQPDEIVSINKGVLLVRLTAHGKRAHGSRPWLGDNAIDKLIATYGRLRATFPLEANAQNIWVPTCNLGIIKGGEAVNQVPDLSTCDLDIRFTEELDAAGAFGRIKKFASDDVQVQLIASGEPIHTDPDHPLVKLYAASVEEHLGHAATFSKACGSNDGRFLTALGIPVIITRPLSGDQHSPDEWLETTSLSDFHRICTLAITRFHASFH